MAEPGDSCCICPVPGLGLASVFGGSEPVAAPAPCEICREDSVPGVAGALQAERLWIAYLSVAVDHNPVVPVRCSLWRGCWKISLSKEVCSGISRLSFVLTAPVTSSMPLAS